MLSDLAVTPGGSSNGIELLGVLHPKAIEAVQANLVGGETVEVVITGPSSQAIIGTDRRAFIYKKGWMAGASFGSELTNWDYRNLVGVQIHTGMMSGAVILQAPGQTGAKTSMWGNKDDDPYKTPNAIPIVRPYEPAQAGVARLRELMTAAQHPTEPAPVASHDKPTVSIADELMKLAGLRDSGVLSEDEFKVLKQALIEKG